MERLAGVSPRLKARLAGLLYFLTGVVAFDEFAVLGRLVVHGDPAATAANILAHQTLFRLGFAAQIIAQVLQIPLAVIFFDLFKVVRRNVSLLVVFFMLMGTAIEVVALLNRFAPLIILNHGNYSVRLSQKSYKLLPMPCSSYMNLGSPLRWCFLDFIASRSDTWSISRPSFPGS